MGLWLGLCIVSSRLICAYGKGFHFKGKGNQLTENRNHCTGNPIQQKGK